MQIFGSLPAEKAAAVVTEKVGEYGLKIGDSIVCSESERAFSAAGLFVTKIRSRMSDDLLERLCFLRAHFL